jgi:hypothetical protein
MFAKTALFLSLLFFFNLTFAQFEYGVKAGIHLSASGSITDATTDLASLGRNREKYDRLFYRELCFLGFGFFISETLSCNFPISIRTLIHFP